MAPGGVAALSPLAPLTLIVAVCLARLPSLVLGAPCGSDRGGLVDDHPVLGGERRRHRELGLAEVPIGRERGERTLRQRQFERSNGYVWDSLERAARDPRFTDERATHQID